MRWRRSIWLTSPARLWAASVVFVVLGTLLAFAAPPLLESPGQDEAVPLVTRTLGGTFLVLGLVVLLPMLLSLRLADPASRKRFHWWINFVGGLLGALAFGVPAALAFPVMFVAYQRGLASLDPNDADAAHNLAIAAVFSLSGVVVLVALFVVARRLLRTKGDSIDFSFETEIDLNRLLPRRTRRR